MFRTRIFVSVLAVVQLALVAGCSSTQPAYERNPEFNDSQPLAASAATLTVEGLSCPLCASNIDKQLMEVEGVESVRVNLSSGQVQLALKDNPRPSRRALADAVDRSGFTLTKIETR